MNVRVILGTVIVYLKDRDSNFANIESARVKKENKVYKLTPYYETRSLLHAYTYMYLHNKCFFIAKYIQI